MEDINTSIALHPCSRGKLSDSRRLTAPDIYDKALFQIRKRCQHGNVTIAVSCDQHRAGIAVGWSHIGFDAIDFPLLDRLFVLGIKLCNKFLSISETETIYFICGQAESQHWIAG